MILVKRKKMYSLLATILILFITLATNTGSVKADGYKPNLAITYEGTGKTTSTDVSGKVDEEVEVKYKVAPDPLDLGDINVISDKEIVLILDTSGSMDWAISSNDSTKRIRALKTAAENFVDKFKNETNTKIGIIKYSDQGNNVAGLTPTNGDSNQKSIKDKIESLQSNGATNTGDGIRYGLNMLNNNSSAKKYVVVMSDGEPTQYTYKQGQWIWDFWPLAGHWERKYYTELTNDGTQKYDGGGNSDPDGKSLEYASTMAKIIKDKKYSAYSIAYSSGASANKMLGLANDSGGKYFSALDATSIDQVYSQIADQIKSAYVVEGVKFNFTLPSNIEYTGSTAELTIDGNNYTQQLPNISYRLNDSKTKYVADKFYISFKFKAKKSGSYTSLGSGWAVTYKGVDGNNITKPLPTFNYSVSNLDIGFNLTRSVKNYSNQAIKGQPLEMDYSIIPEKISVANTRKPKQVVLLVDSSYSKKDDIRSFLNKFSGITDASFALVTYDTGAVLSNFGTDAQPSYFVGATNSTLISKINSITGSTGSNLGEGMRKALFALNNTQDVNRRIVIFGENDPSYYSYAKAEDGTVNYYEELDNSIGSLTEGQANTLTYGADSAKSEEYTKLIAQKIVDAKNLAVSIIASGDGTNDSVLGEVSSIASTEFNQLSTNDDITKLKNIVNSDLIINARVYEVLPSGINFEGNTSTLNRGIKIFYNYDNTNKCYVGIPVGVSVNMIPNQVGNLNLNNSKLYYTDIEGIELNKSFDNLALNVVGGYDIKQGMFFKQQSDRGNFGVGESYITNLNSQDRSIAIHSNLGMGALIKTSGQSTTVSIDVNSSNIRDINISNISTVVYTVNKDDNKLSTPITLTPTVTNNGKMVTLTFSLPAGTPEETYYLINYNYKISTTLTDEAFNNKYPNGVDISNKCYIVGDSTPPNVYNYPIVTLRDLF